MRAEKGDGLFFLGGILMVVGALIVLAARVLAWAGVI